MEAMSLGPSTTMLFHVAKRKWLGSSTARLVGIHYPQGPTPRSQPDAIDSTLLVNEISWSPDFLSPATVAMSTELISSRGDLLWSKTEPIGSRPKEAVIQDLLTDLAQDKPSLNGTKAKTAEAGERKETSK